jgi:UDP:flavonoid glycosyltransferase YjiC (YdhE family)
MSELPDRPRGRFLMAVIDGGGTLPPALGVAAELVRRGHSVTVLSDPTVEASAAAAGCAFLPWRAAPHFDSVDDQTAMVTEFERGSPLRQFAAIRDRLIVGGAPGFADDVVRALTDHPADALLVEAVVPGILIGAQTAGLPTAALMPNVYLRPTPGLPQMGTGWRPGRGPVGRARDAVVRGLVGRFTATCTPGLNTTLTAHGLPGVGDMWELLDRCTEVLVLTSPSFDFPARLPANVHYVGPQLDDPEWATAATWRPDGDRPLVLVAGSSTFQRQTDLLRRAATALGELPVRGVVTTGRAVDPADVPAPANVRVVRAAPHRTVLAEAAAMVTHAGHGSVLKALAAGVPLVCLPMGRDQKDNTVRVLRLRAGVRVRQQAPPDRIAAAVRSVLDDRGYATAAAAFADRLAVEAKTRPTAADRAEALLPA